MAEQTKGLTGVAVRHPGKPLGYISADVINEGLRELKLAGQIETAKAADLYYTNQIADKVGSAASAR